MDVLGHLRILVVWLACTLLTGGVAALAVPDQVRAGLALAGAGEAPTFVALLTALAGIVATVTAAWLWGVVTLVAVAGLRGIRLGRVRTCPEAIRRLLAALCGLALTGTLTGTLAAPAATEPARPRSPVPVLVRGLTLPDRVESLPGSPVPGSLLPDSLVVVPGDTLWGLAAATLPRGAEDAAINQRWHHLYRENRATIGPDPDLIFPGTRLALPVAWGPTGEEPR